MKFTSEDLLKAMGLKVGQRVLIPVYDNTEFIITKDCLKNKFCTDLSVSVLVDEDFTIIQPKPTLTEDEKVILGNVPQEYKYVMRDSYRKGGNLVLSKRFPERNWVLIGGDGYWLDNGKQFPCTMLALFNHLFQFIKWEDEPYPIEELLKE